MALMITATDVDTILSSLEKQFEEDCQYKHIHTVCSHTVVALGIGCVIQVRVCRSAYQALMARMGDPKKRCRGCKKDSLDCWRLIPL